MVIGWNFNRDKKLPERKSYFLCLLTTCAETKSRCVISNWEIFNGLDAQASTQTNMYTDQFQWT